MAATTPPKVLVLFEHEGVFVHSSTDDGDDQDLLISGFLRVLDKDGESVIEYKPLEDSVDPSNMLCACKDSSSVVEWTQFPTDRSHHTVDPQQSCETEWDMVNTVSFKRKPHANGEGTSHHTHEKNRWAFSFTTADLRTVTLKTEGWTHLVFCLKDDTTLSAIHFHQGGSQEFMDCLRRCVHLTESPRDKTTYLVSSHNKALSQSFENLLDDTNYGLVQKLKKDPYTATLGGFSKVTNYIFDAFRAPELEQRDRPEEEVADILGEIIPGLEISQLEEPGFEVITRVDLGSRPEVQRGDPLTLEEWLKYQDQEGRVRKVPQLKERIFKGGLCHVVRREAWKFLLGYYPWNSTSEERKGLQRRKTDEYFRMKLQWKSVSEEQERRNSRLRDYKSLIEKDVNRTDRTNKFYEGLENPGLILLHDILMTYCMYDFDLGYVQGMSDLLSPILFVMENEVDAFWCFVNFMDEMHENFEEKMQGMRTQLVQLSALLRLLDLAFWNYLEAQDSGYLYFCFRWLLIRFKRELHFQDVLRLWEVMWTGLPCQNFHLLVCCAILDSEKQKIMDRHYGFNEILKHINELSMKLDIEEILHKSEAICLQIKNCKDLPSSVSEILGLKVACVKPTLELSDYGILTPPLHTSGELLVSNGHGQLSETSSNGYKVAFIS
ncbi:TBC1 domain family member 15 isoform X1 [Sardina pilchardus]|uniref:TBC1 domain family member 15 isoform X1 n=2 Tax=Sardina pilchardus TaxID=27697 RepID=UPI002E137253